MFIVSSCWRERQNSYWCLPFKFSTKVLLWKWLNVIIPQEIIPVGWTEKVSSVDCFIYDIYIMTTKGRASFASPPDQKPLIQPNSKCQKTHLYLKDIVLFIFDKQFLHPPPSLKHFSRDLRPCPFQFAKQMSVCFWPLCWRSPEGLEKTLVVPHNLQEFLKYATFGRKKACGGKSEEKAPTEEEQHMDKYSFQFLLCVSTNGHVTLLVPVIQSKQCFVEFIGKWACFWSRIIFNNNNGFHL